MATPDDLKEIRRRAALEETDAVYTDTLLGQLLDAYGMLPATLRVWQEKAATYAELVSVSEAGSSRSLGDLIKNAKLMIELYEGLVAQEVDAASGGRPFTVPIERP